MDEGENVGGRGVFSKGGDDGSVGEKIARIGAFEGTGLDVKDVYEYTYITKGLRLLRCKVGFCESVLAVSLMRISQIVQRRVHGTEAHGRMYVWIHTLHNPTD